MKIKLLKITRSARFAAEHYCDFEFTDIGLVVKGMIMNKDSGYIGLPVSNTKLGKKYSLITFPDKEVFKEVMDQMAELFKQNIDSAVEETGDQKRFASPTTRTKRFDRKELQGKVGKASAGCEKNSSFVSPLSPDSKKEIETGVRICPGIKTNHQIPISKSFRERFTEVPLSKRGY